MRFILLMFLFPSLLSIEATPQVAAPPPASTGAPSNPDLQRQVDELQKLVQQLEQRIAALENKDGKSAKASTKPSAVPQSSSATAASSPHAPQPAAGNATTPSTSAPTQAAAIQNGQNSATPSPSASVPTAATPPAQTGIPAFLDGTTLNFTIDGYYEYNFNRPIGQMNQLRAYDLSSNSFSLNQADIILDHPTDAAHGKRIGARLDLMFGQATETLQGNANNELYPSVWRNVFQAYGTYVAPVGSGLNVDFGKWASSLGVEDNYTQDNFNYTRSLFFNFLPYYHMGFRTAYTFNPKLTVAYWLVNGAQQTDAFSGFKSQNFAFTLHPVGTVSWQINYFFGQQQRSFTLSGNANETQTATAITPTPNGKEHIFDTYATWNATPKLTFIGEADYVVDRVYSESAPKHVAGGEAYINYQWTPKLALAARAEYLADPQGLFSGTSQALKETTLTAGYLLENQFKIYMEWRRDFSNQLYFDTATAGHLVPQQTTATMGLVWWFGQLPLPW